MFGFIHYDISSAYWKWIGLGLTAGIGVFLIRRRIAGPVFRGSASLKGKTVVITGASSGIGKATALELARRHGRIIMACRDLDKAEKARDEIRSKTENGELIIRKLDLSSLKSVRDFAERLCNEEICIDVLINNAGVYGCPYQLTEDGLEMQMAVNHLGHFLLVHLLLDKLKASVPSRVVVVSSGLSKYGKIDFNNLNGSQGYQAVEAYKNSKLANNLFARELARRTRGTGVGVHCLRPGMVRTDLGRHVQFNVILRWLGWPLAWLLVRNSYEGCQTVLHCVLSDELVGTTGGFYADCAQEEWNIPSRDDEIAQKLWTVSEELTGIRAASAS